MTRSSFPAGPSPSFEFRVASGRLDIIEAEDDQITVDVNGRGADNIMVEQIGGTVSIREDRSRFLDRSVSVRLAVPRGTNADISAASLDVLARVELGRVHARTASGQLDFGRVGTAEIRSASGDVSINACEGRCQISTASGDIRSQTIEGDLIVNTASGDVSVESVGGRVEIKSASGDIELACCVGPVIEVVSMSGDVNVGLPGGCRVDAQIDSLSGHVSLPPRRPAGTESKDAVRLRMKTVSGDVRLQRVES